MILKITRNQFSRFQERKFCDKSGLTRFLEKILTVNKNSSVCELQFTETDIQREIIFFYSTTGKRISISLNKPRIQEGAIPSIFRGCPSYLIKEISHRENRDDKNLSKGLLLGLGNPLLDISALTDHDFLKKYDMKPNDAILAEEKHLPMYSEMAEKYKVDYTVGGACQNTMRVGQWILQTPNVFAFMGCIGKDKFGEILESKAKEAGVLVAYQYHDTVPTGTCAVVITDQGANRSLCANLSAANHFSKTHIDNPDNQSLIQDAKYFYITSFFLTVSPPTIMEIAEHACKYDKPFCMNLSAPFLSQFFKEPMMKAFPYIDILFGNEQEAATFASEHNFGTTDVEEIALRIQNLPKENKSRSRIVIITQGKEPVICAKDGVITKYPAISVPPEEIVDTNGAGDAFVGGFLAQYIQGKSLNICINCGIYAATEVIKQSGCSLPEKPQFSE